MTTQQHTLPTSEILAADENVADVKDFFEQWALYQKIVRCNYLHHNEVCSLLQEFVSASFSSPFLLLDLGCGDASLAAKAMQGTPLAGYVGVDLSAVALHLAEENLQSLCCSRRLVQQDMMAYLADEHPGADLIWSGLAMHHLSSFQKERFFRRCSETLGSEGYLLIFEPVMREDEGKEEHCLRWWKTCKSGWASLDWQEKRRIARHVFRSDYPESFSTLEHLAEANAFSQARHLYTDPSGIYQMICFEKGA